MPKLIFEPKVHIIGDNEDIFITATNEGEPTICIKCNDVAAFIIKKMYPDHKPRTEIAEMVAHKFGCTSSEATRAVETVISALLTEKENTENEE